MVGMLNRSNVEFFSKLETEAKKKVEKPHTFFNF